MKGENIRKLHTDNTGVTLVELIVVITIMSILVGVSSLGIGLAFSRDAESCATKINDAIYNTRMYSLSKAGKYTLHIEDSNNGTGNTQYVAKITLDAKDAAGNALPTQIVETTYLEGTPGKNTVSSIAVNLKKNDGTNVNVSLPLDITFEKSKGCVLVGSGYGLPADGVVDFYITPARGNHDAHVTLITATGKHKVGEF